MKSSFYRKLSSLVGSMSLLLFPIPEQLKEVTLDEEGESRGIGRECPIGSLALLSSIESAVIE